MLQDLIKKLRDGNIQALARIISLIENDTESCAELLRSLPYSNKRMIGITGPPGAGKSTVVDCLIEAFIQQQKKIAVLCIDPSSPFTKGALLGDRIRMNKWYNNPDVYIRSLASRGNAHGLHPAIIEITDVIKTATFDEIIIETVGAGQTETQIAALADTTIVVLVPEAGDEVQNMKAGLMEIADIFLVNKSDRPEADRFIKNLRAMLMLSSNQKQKNAPVIKTVAIEKKGIDELVQHIIQNNKNETSAAAKNTLLAEKAYMLIQQKRMKDVQLETLEKEIKAASGNKNFNLYRFIDQF
jgi:LAO/AO transport system kinase